MTKAAGPGDAVYFDPPYAPLSRTASFTAYHRLEFGENEHQRLADALAALTASRVACVLSNSCTPFTESLYGGRRYRVERVDVGRPINSRASSRGPVTELLVSNAGARRRG